MISYLDLLAKRPVDPDSLSRKFWPAALLALLIYWVCLRFLFPGYFAPLSPFHIDIYDYVGTREKSFLTLLLKYPRPVAYFAMKTLGAGGVRGLLAGEIAITIASVLLTAWLAARMLQIRSRWMPGAVAIYLVLLFAHPDFYFEHRHDLPADVSYLFLILGLMVFRLGTKAGMAAGAVCMVLSAFSKETYFVSALLLVVAMAISSPGRRLRHVVFLAFIGIVEIVSISYTSHINSPFVNANADVHATYHINVEPAVVAQTYWFYVSHLVNPALGLMVAAGMMAAWWSERRRFAVLVVFVAAGLAVFATHAVLPNHLFEEYAWAGAPLFLIPVLVLLEAGPGWRVAAGILAIGAVFGYSRNYGTEMLKYMVEEDEKGRALMPSLGELKRLPRPARVLVAGLEDPVNPWEVPDYVRSEFGGQLHWSILLPREVQFRRNGPVTRFLGPEDVGLTDYDYLARYDSGSRLLEVRKVKSVPEAEQRNAALLLVPSLGPVLEQGRREPRNYGLFLQCADASLRWGFLKEASDCLDRAREAGGNGDATMAQLRTDLAARRAEAAAVKPAARELPELTAKPQRITQVNAEGLGVTELFWRVPPGTAFEIHVGTPDGPLFAKGQQSGHQMTQQWVRDGTKFFLQDVTEGQPLTLKTTMATVTVNVAR